MSGFLTRMMMPYKFGLDEVLTKINILKEDFTYVHEYSPIEHVTSRLKSPEEISRKAARKGCRLTPDDVRLHVRDIAGVRVTCSFKPDVYLIHELLAAQSDLTVLQVKDYIAAPKPNGYRSLHLAVEVPVFMTDRTEVVPVEIQIRTVAMDFWASVEHKIFYKYNGDVPPGLAEELKEAAAVVDELDTKVDHLHRDAQLMHSPTQATYLSLAELQGLPLPPGMLEDYLKRQPGQP